VPDPKRSPTPRCRALLLLPALAAAAVVMVACGAQSSSVEELQPATGVAKPLTGSDVYQMSCARCHGSNREGKTDAPKLDAVRMASLGDQPLRMAIQYGKGRMRGFGGLSQAQVDALVEYLRGA
jgi:mono/diheme cytochrome c family protein